MKKLLLISLCSVSITSFADGVTIPSGTTFVANIKTGATLNSGENDPTPITAVVNFRSSTLSQNALDIMNMTNATLGIDPSKKLPICNILGDGVLDSSSLRAKVRTTSISCIYPDGKQYSAPLQGWFVDYNDNLAGVNVKNTNNSIMTSTNVYIVVGQTIKLLKIN